MIESLEPRRLCAGVRHVRPVFGVDDAGTVHVSGSVGNDTIVLIGSRRGVRLYLNGRYVDVNQHVRRAEVYGGGGDDLVSGMYDYMEDVPAPAGNAALPLYVDGGIGRDTLWAGMDDTTLLGGAGDDRLEGREYWVDTSNVYMDAGPGDDTLRFGNVMHGGAGRDEADIDTNYGSPTFTSGLEREYNISYGPGYGTSLAGSSDLTTRNGRLVLTYTTDGGYERNVSDPFLRDDGPIGLTITRDDPREGVPDRPVKKWIIPLSDRYTARALAKGLVLNFVGSAAKNLPTEWLILRPPGP